MVDDTTSQKAAEKALRWERRATFLGQDADETDGPLHLLWEWLERFCHRRGRRWRRAR